MTERSDLSPTLPSDDDEELLPERGASIGRFLVLGALGAGGMGMVLSAYDPTLDRKVALKLLRATQGTAASEAIVREAQTMARLTHPNVVAVHEVGFGESGGYVVMEQVDGTTLRAWMAERERPWREIVDMFLAAGAGLSAAHGAGIVHQDFKPENVLVGSDGRPRVSDFGLAGSTARAAGTKGYMAPEQQRDGAIDARADQYAFCVTLWEALEGERPTGDLSPPARRRAPAWLYRVLARGLSRDPEGRWASMDELLAKLRRRSRLGASSAVVACAVVVVGVAAFVAGRDRATPEVCAGAETRLAGVWDPGRRQAVEAAFAAVGVPYAGASFREVSARLDDYTRRWVAMHDETCRATRVEGRQSDTLMDLRMACLERRRGVLGELTGLWARGMDRDTLGKAIDAAGALPQLGECADTRALTERLPMPTEPAIVDAIAAARARLDVVHALALAGRRADARKAAAEARALADKIDWPQLRAEAAHAEGDILGRLGENGEEALLAAVRFAGAARDDRLAARALIELVGNIAADQQQAERASLVADIAEAMVSRAGNDPTLRGLLLRHRGEALLVAGKHDQAQAAASAAYDQMSAAYGPRGDQTLITLNLLARIAQGRGDFAGARKMFEEHLAALTPVLGADDPRLAISLSNLASAVEQTGDRERAAELYRRALVIKERSLGPEAASTAYTLNNLGMVELARGDVTGATALLERALSIRERIHGPSHALVAMTLVNLASARGRDGRPTEALALLDRALKIASEVYGEAHPNLVYPLSNIGHVLEDGGKAAEALGYYRRAAEIGEKGLGGDHPLTLKSLGEVAGALGKLRRCGEARPLHERAVAGLERTLGADHPELAPALTAAAGCDAPAAAVPRLRRAILLHEKAGSAPVDRGAARWQLARSLWSLGRRAEALAEAERADTELAGTGEQKAVRAWLVARAPAHAHAPR